VDERVVGGAEGTEGRGDGGYLREMKGLVYLHAKETTIKERIVSARRSEISK
jgi:hypothetical protein